MIQKQKDQVKSVVRMRDQEAIPKDIRLLQEQASELVNSRSEWVGKALLDEGFALRLIGAAVPVGGGFVEQFFQ